jgi:hypothetical protein
VSVHIDHVQTELDVRPPGYAGSRPGGSLPSVLNGIDRAELERIRPMVLLILREELDRLRRQQG